MSPADNLAGLLAVLGDFFSPPIARLVLHTTVQRLSLDPSDVPAGAVAGLVRALSDALPSYLGDPQKREQCIARMVACVPEGESVRASVPHPSPSIPTRHNSKRPPGARLTADFARSMPVRSAEDMVAVCDAVRDLCRRIGFPHVVETKIATAVAELARNLQLYAQNGEVRIASIGLPPRGLEVITTDQGPGIANLDLVLGGKYRSRTGMGMGLRGARRLMDTFDISTSPAGTRVVVRKYLT